VAPGMSESPGSKFDEAQDEPLFTAIGRMDGALQAAYDRAAATMGEFIRRLGVEGEGYRAAKLRFRDPDESERLGEDRFLFLWLGGVHYYADENVFSGVFFEVPAGFEKWHEVGEQLVFEADQVFDWMILDDGHLHGGFTLRVQRERLPEAEREGYDQYVGVRVYEPVGGGE